MLYARVNKETDEVLEFPLTEKELRDSLVNTTLPSRITEMTLAGTDYVMVPPVGPDEITVQATAEMAIKAVSCSKDPETGKWVRTYGLEEVPEAAKLPRLSGRWNYLRTRRDRVLRQIDWMVLRNQREVALGLTPTDNIDTLYAKAQELADITDSNEDPFLIDASTITIE
jgi:hypothetical protein